MKILARNAYSLSSRCTLSFAFATALLGGCVATQTPTGVPGALPNAATEPGGRRSGDLLYVVNGGETVVFLTFPDGKPAGQLSVIGHPLNVCSDTSGNVWFTSYLATHKYRLYEFAHDGTQPIATIDVPRSKSAVACAVNPANGDLAVLDNYGGTGNDAVLIWPGARSGKPKEYTVHFVPTACAYDERGNLFATGWEDSDGYYFEELKSGAALFTNVSVQPHSFLVGSVRWDGRYFAVAMAQRRGSLMYRLRVAGSMGKVVQVIHLKPLANPRWFAIKGGKMVATKLSRGEKLLGIWNYPLGGTPVTSFRGPKDPTGLAISAGHRQ